MLEGSPKESVSMTTNDGAPIVAGKDPETGKFLEQRCICQKGKDKFIDKDIDVNHADG